MLFIPKKKWKEDKTENKYLSLKDYVIEFLMVYFWIDEEGKRERGSTLFVLMHWRRCLWWYKKESWDFMKKNKKKGKEGCPRGETMNEKLERAEFFFFKWISDFTTFLSQEKGEQLSKIKYYLIKKKKIQESERAAEEVRQRRGGNKRAEIRCGGGNRESLEWEIIIIIRKKERERELPKSWQRERKNECCLRSERSIE